MTTRAWLLRGLVVATSAVVALISAAASFLLFLQPWRSCPEIDDSSAGCPALPRDVALLQISVVVFLVAVLVLVLTVALTLIKLDKPRRTSRPDDGQGAQVRYGLIGGDPAVSASTRYEQQGTPTSTKRPR